MEKFYAQEIYKDAFDKNIEEITKITNGLCDVLAKHELNIQDAKLLLHMLANNLDQFSVVKK